MRLHQYAEDPISLAARSCDDPLRHFLLKHPHHLRNPRSITQHVKDDLGGNIVGKIANQAKRCTIENVVQWNLQKIRFDNRTFELGIMRFQIGHHVAVRLHCFQPIGAIQQKTGEHPLPRANLQDVATFRCQGQAAGNPLCDGIPVEKVLPEGFLRFQ